MCAELSPDGSNELDSRPTSELKLDLDAFGREALEAEAARLGVSPQELARHAVLYYLADCESGRISRRPPLMRPPGQAHPPGQAQAHPLGELLDG